MTTAYRYFLGFALTLALAACGGSGGGSSSTSTSSTPPSSSTPNPPPTPDTTPPTVPTNLSATVISATQINLSWSASTDANGVARYQIFRNGSTTPLSQPTGTSYADTTVSPSTTYSYRVRAMDNSNNTSVLSNTASATTPAATSGCASRTLSDKLVPSCGALWGFYTSGNGDVRPAEQVVGRRFDVVHYYHDFSNVGGNGVFPTALELSYLSEGRAILLGWETRIYNIKYRDLSMPAPAGTGNVYTYNQITSGALDAYLDQVVARVKAAGKPIFMNFDHEPDDSTYFSNGSNANRRAAGTPAEFVAAWRYLVNKFRAGGATNAIWVWGMAGFQSSDSVYQQLYPGDDYVDWVGWDPYNFYSCNGRTTWKDVPATFGPFYRRLDNNMLGTVAAAKPRMLLEYGSHDDPNDPTRLGNWYRSIPGHLKNDFPKIKALLQFNSTGVCDSHVMSPPAQPDTQAGFIEAGQDPYFAP